VAYLEPLMKDIEREKVQGWVQGSGFRVQ
jgi:hypothetical protein